MVHRNNSLIEITSFHASHENCFVGGRDGIIRVFAILPFSSRNIHSHLQERHSFNAHVSLISGLVEMHHQLISASTDGCIKVWNLHTLSCDHIIHIPEIITCLALHGNNNVLIGTSKGLIYSLSNLQSSPVASPFLDQPQHNARIDLIANLSSGSCQYVPSSGPDGLRIWDLKSRECIYHLEFDMVPSSHLLVARDQSYIACIDDSSQLLLTFTIDSLPSHLPILSKCSVSNNDCRVISFECGGITGIFVGLLEDGTCFQWDANKRILQFYSHPHVHYGRQAFLFGHVELIHEQKQCIVALASNHGDVVRFCFSTDLFEDDVDDQYSNPRDLQTRSSNAILRPSSQFTLVSPESTIPRAQTIDPLSYELQKTKDNLIYQLQLQQSTKAELDAAQADVVHLERQLRACMEELNVYRTRARTVERLEKELETAREEAKLLRSSHYVYLDHLLTSSRPHYLQVALDISDIQDRIRRGSKKQQVNTLHHTLRSWKCWENDSDWDSDSDEDIIYVLGHRKGKSQKCADHISADTLEQNPKHSHHEWADDEVHNDLERFLNDTDTPSYNTSSQLRKTTSGTVKHSASKPVNPPLRRHTSMAVIQSTIPQTRRSLSVMSNSPSSVASTNMTRRLESLIEQTFSIPSWFKKST